MPAPSPLRADVPKELDEIVGPIALYPDIVVSSILPAATVPLDVVQAARWVAEQSGEIEEPPKDSDWDEAVDDRLMAKVTLIFN